MTEDATRRLRNSRNTRRLANRDRKDCEVPNTEIRTSEAMLFTVEEAADILGIGRTTIYKLLNSGDLLGVKIGRARRVPRSELDRYVAARLTMATAA